LGAGIQGCRASRGGERAVPSSARGPPAPPHHHPPLQSSQAVQIPNNRARPSTPRSCAHGMHTQWARGGAGRTRQHFADGAPGQAARQAPAERPRAAGRARGARRPMNETERAAGRMALGAGRRVSLVGIAVACFESFQPDITGLAEPPAAGARCRVGGRALVFRQLYLCVDVLQHCQSPFCPSREFARVCAWPSQGPRRRSDTGGRGAGATVAGGRQACFSVRVVRLSRSDAALSFLGGLLRPARPAPAGTCYCNAHLAQGRGTPSTRPWHAARSGWRTSCACEGTTAHPLAQIKRSAQPWHWLG
jgi:hypothetical protein